MVKRLLVFPFALAVAGCGGGGPGNGGGISGEVTVFAAVSLTDAFSAVGRAFEEEHPGARVLFNFAGTPTLRTQLEHGARADVFASANEEQMALAVRSGVVAGEPVPFATNRLVVIAPAGRATVRELRDLEKPGAKLVLALPDVPAGGYTREVLRRLEGSAGFPAGFADRVLANLVSEETNVRQVVAKVALGEADAGLVYGTDVTPDLTGRVRIIEIPEESNVAAAYPIARVRGGPNPAGGKTFVDFLLSADGQAILGGYGFGVPARQT